MQNKVKLSEDPNGFMEACFNAIFLGNSEFVALLLANGADIDARDKRGDVSLHYAMSAKSKEIVEFLVEGGAKVPSLFAFPEWRTTIKNAQKRRDAVPSPSQSNSAVSAEAASEETQQERTN